MIVLGDISKLSLDDKAELFMGSVCKVAEVLLLDPADFTSLLELMARRSREALVELEQEIKTKH